MERESFENDAIAEIMNRHFINIKVDREERPDLDAVYMEAVQMLTGSGGWPMTVFLTPDCKPFYGGTYFPPVDRHNMPGFPRLLETVAHAYRNSHSEIQRVTGQLTEQMGRTANMPRGTLAHWTRAFCTTPITSLPPTSTTRTAALARRPSSPKP